METGKIHGAGGILGATAVPEPHEWVLIFFGFGLVVYFYWGRIKSLRMSFLWNNKN